MSFLQNTPSVSYLQIDKLEKLKKKFSRIYARATILLKTLFSSVYVVIDYIEKT